MPKLNGKTYAYTKKGKKRYKEALMKSKKREDGDILYGSKNVRVQRIVHDSDDATQVYRDVRIKNPFKKNKNLFERTTKKHLDKKSGKSWKSTYTKIGEKRGRLKGKDIAKDKVTKDYMKTDKRIKKRRTKRN